MNTLLDSLHKKRLVWSAKQAPEVCANVTSTGFALLDEQLQGGWPETGMIGVQSTLGIGELRLILPCLKQRLGTSNRLVVAINPPYSLNAEAFLAQGIAPDNILVIHGQDQQAQLWSAEQCLKSGCSAAVLLWHGQYQMHQVKRFQLAAQQGDALLFAFYQQHQAGLPFSLALHLSPEDTGIKVDITKRQGGWPAMPISLNWQQSWPKLTVSPSAAEPMVPNEINDHQEQVG